MSDTEEQSTASEDFSEIIRVLGSHAFFSMLHQEQEGEPSVEAQCQLYKELYAMFDEFVKAKETEYYEEEEEDDVIVLADTETEVDYGNCAECGVALSMEYIVNKFIDKFISLPEDQWFCEKCHK